MRNRLHGYAQIRVQRLYGFALPLCCFCTDFAYIFHFFRVFFLHFARILHIFAAFLHCYALFSAIVCMTVAQKLCNRLSN